MKPSYWGNIIYENAMSLYHTEDEAREESWMQEQYFPLYSEESVKELQEAYTAEMLLNGEMAERIKELEEEVHFLLGISNWDNINRAETDKLIVLYKKHKRMDSEGNLK